MQREDILYLELLDTLLEPIVSYKFLTLHVIWVSCVAFSPSPFFRNLFAHSGALRARKAP